MRFLRVMIACAATSLAASNVAIAAPTSVKLEPMQMLDATLAIEAADGTVHTYTPTELEAFPTYRLETTTPWREVPAVFEGVLLKDVLAAHGLDDMEAVEVIAENDFSTRYEREVWTSVPVLIATRVDGQPHSRRARGPLQFVIAMEDYDGSDLLEERHYVWMAAQIKAMD